MRKNILSFVVCLCVISCSETDDAANRLPCMMNDPVKELPWLQEKIRSLEEGDSRISIYYYVMQGEWAGETIFLIGNCCPFCGTRTLAFNCHGEELSEYSPGVVIDNKKVIWEPDDHSCGF